MRGKLIVIEGGDGSGKATQTKLLVEYLRGQNIPTETLSFPRYNDSFYGKLVGRFLAGEFGSLDSVSPYLASLPYALDRRDARDEMETWLGEGKIIVVDRYVTSSLAHQAAKLPMDKREEFIVWLKEMEYEQNKMPRPDIVVFLSLPWKEAVRLSKQRQRTQDIADKDIEHQKNASEVYRFLAQNDKTWKTIDCIGKDGKLLSIPEVHTELLHILRMSLNIDEIK